MGTGQLFPMRRIFQSFLYTFLLLFSVGCYASSAPTENSGSMKSFILGKWEIYNKNDLRGVYYSSLDFVDANTLICSINDADGTIHNNVYEYKFTEDNYLEISGNRTGDELNVYKDGDILVVKSELNPMLNMNFKRGAYINWPAIALILSGGLIGMSFVRMRDQQVRIKEKDKRGKLWFDTTNFVIFLISLLLGVYISNLNFLLKITLPWDGIIILEISMAFLIAGAKTRKYFPSSHIGILLLGLSIWGIVASMTRIILYLTFGYYPL
jgi:hypothetical protein